MSEERELTLEDRNRAAHAWRDTFATKDDPMEGIQIGWTDLDESTRWILGVLDDAEEMTDADEGPHEVADAAAGRLNTYRALRIISELPSWVASEYPQQLEAGNGSNVADLAMLALYEVAYALASTAGKR